jgi:uncharacterized protein (TIGR04255 family)
VTGSIECLAEIRKCNNESPMNKLPKSLENEPLVDAVFEVRFRDAPPLADILPGALFGVLQPISGIQRLPAADIPFPLRAQDPSLKYAPLLRLEVAQYLVAVGDSSIVLSCKLPYPKWPQFKEFIKKISTEVLKINIPANVERYALKYVNLIQNPQISEQLKKIRTSISLGDVSVKDEQVSLQVHHKEGKILHIMSVMTGAQGVLPDNTNVFGAVVDIDSIVILENMSFEAFVDVIDVDVEALRQANKAKFFSCLTPEAIQEMRPTYE